MDQSMPYIEVSEDSQLQDLIRELRHKLLDNFDQCPEDYDPIDIDKIKTNDFQIKRFLTYNNLNAKQAFAQLNDTMKWRKSHGIKRDYSQIGLEVFRCGGLFIYGSDVEGRPVLYARVKTHVKITELEKMAEDIIIETLERLDQLSGERGFTVVMDVSGTGLSNVDLNIAKFLITVMRKYYPESVKCILVVNLPWLMQTFMPFIKLLLGSKYSHMLHTIDGTDIFKYISRDNVPKYLGGNSTFDFTQPPDECTKKAEDLAHNYGMSPSLVRKAIKKFEPHMIEAKKLVRTS